MSKKTLPLSDCEFRSLLEKAETPFYLYDGDAIKENVRALYDAFSWANGFINFFAVKALPNMHMLRFLSSLGLGADTSSLVELRLARESGIDAEKIVFTSNDTADEEFKEALKMGVLVNIDDICHIDRIKELALPWPERICFRYNPGSKRTGNAIIGNPVEAKYGVRDDQIVGVDISLLDLGGGVGIPYRLEDDPISFYSLASKIKALYDDMIIGEGLNPVRISFEMGRAITGPFGYLISKVRHVSHKYKDYVGLDACMANLMRPALYGAYHHITVLGKEADEKDHVYDVTGSLCENNDKFAIDRRLPKIERGDVVVIHDAGAHGHSMGFNYNGKLRSAELLLQSDGSVRLIRRAETPEDYFATLIF